MGLRIAVIGMGGLGYLQAKTYRELDAVTIVAAADVAAEGRELFETEFEAPAYKNHRALLESHGDELDAVTIVTPHTLHYDQAMACLHRDLHVLIEKPMVTNVEHAVDIVETATERELVVQVGYQRHFHPAFRQIRRLIENDYIGDLRTVSCFISQNWIANHEGTWRVDPEFSGGGQLYDTGSHLLEALLWITGSDPVSVSAQIDFFEPAVDVDSALTLELDSNGDRLLASVAICGNGRDMIPNEGYFIWGSEGSISYSDGTLVVSEANASPYRSDIPQDFDFNALNKRKLRNFVKSIDGTEPPAVPAEVGLEVTALTEATYVAEERGERVPIEEFLREHSGHQR